jgi:hypothetical protein
MNDTEYDYHYEYKDDCRYNGLSCLKNKIESDLKDTSITYQDGTYYKGDNSKITNNYLWYSGEEYRIMGINSDGSIKIVSSLPVVSLSFGSSTYENSYVRKWLNVLSDNINDGVFYKSLHRSDFIENYNFCIGSQDPSSDTDTTCSNKILDKIGLLTWWEYKVSGNNSYLNIKDRLLFSTFDSKNPNNILSTNYTGSIFLDDNSTYATYPLDSFYSVNSIRPVMNLKSTLAIFSGNGTKNNPYRLSGDEPAHKNDFLSTRNIGEYIMIGTTKYRIVSIDNNRNIKVVSDSRITSTGTDKSELYTYFDRGNNSALCEDKWPYINCNNIFNPSDGNDKYNGDMGHNIGYFLNNTFYNDLGKYKDYLVDDTYYLGKWGIGSDYNNVYTNNITSKVGMLRYGEMLAGNNLNSSVNTNNYWLITPYDSYFDSLYISVSGNINIALPSYDSVGIRPTITLKSTIKIISGAGTKENPYVIF